MKFVHVMFALIIFVYVCEPLKQPRSILNDILSRRLKYNNNVAINSNCGNTSCLYSTDCPSFPFISASCVNDYCEYNDTSDHRVCTDPSECGTSHYCDCTSTLASDGCKCESNATCDSGACYEGVCQPNYGYIGEFCSTDMPYCNAGVCNKSNLCELVPYGGGCSQDSDCDPKLYCGGSDTCIQRPPCNTTIDGDYGFCPGIALCYQGTCIPWYTQAQGESCFQQENCQPGLTCANNGTQSISTCQPVNLGTPCASGHDCAWATQSCLCSEPDDSSPTVCSDAGFQLCTDELIAVYNCFVAENCFLYDVDDVSTNCSKKCLPILNQLICCGICRYPEYSDNAYLNFAGSCKDNTFEIVDCCSSSDTPCTIIETEKLCAGY